MRENISGKRIKLKRPVFNIENAKVIYSVINRCRDVFSPWLDWANGTNSADDTLKFLEKADDDWKNNTQFVYEIHVGEKFAGLISAINIVRQHKRAEIGYWLGTENTGKGFMAEAVSLLEKELFADGFNRIVIQTDVLNAKSAGVAKRCGYILEGVLRQERYSERLGRFRDTNVFSKLKADLK